MDFRLKLYFIIFYQFSLFFNGISVNIIVDELSIGQPHNYTLNSTNLYIIEVQNLSNIIEKVPPRIFVRCEKCDGNSPLLIVAGLNKGVMSWELPIDITTNSYNSVYKNTERTLCPYDILNNTNALPPKLNNSSSQRINPVRITLSTSNYNNVTVEILVNLEKNFNLNLNSNNSVTVTPSTPSFFLYDFESENVTSVLLHVTSEDDACLILSIQNVSCPVFDLVENIGYRGHFQTITRQGGLTLTKQAFPNGFYVVLIVSNDDKYCSNLLPLSSVSQRNKTVWISISQTISSQDYFLAIGLTVLLIALFCTIMFLIFFFSIKCQNIIEVVNDDILITDKEESTSVVDYDHPAVSSSVTSDTPITPATSAGGDNLSIKTDSSLDEADFDLVCDVKSDKNVVRMKKCLYLSDLARKNHSVLKKKSELYFWNLLTVGIFYFLPVFQLVYTDQCQLNQSGREDLCYYNFLCAHPLWLFSDFNHMFSNIGYISFGVLFMFLVALKERDYKVKISCNKNLCRNYGIPQHFGIFHSMGAALIIEGILSLCYHICPNHYNFQFDTSFMYVICTLCIIKIYQTRHPDINANAYATFGLLAGVILLGMYGVFKSNLTFWIVFTIIHLSVSIYLSLQIYYMGRLRLAKFFGISKIINSFRESCGPISCRLEYFKPEFRSRFCLLVVANIFNWGLAIGSFLYKIENFSSYLLTIFMVNLVLYTAFYILMKFICGEKLTVQSIIYIILAMLCWSIALYFFFNKTISWKLTPAESRLYNQKCKLLDFYDNHDIWHFISAGAMFFSFMVLLNLDDDLINVQRSEIVVF